MSLTPRVLSLTLTLSFISLISGGCVNSSVTRIGQHKLSSPAGTASTAFVREPGLYKVKWVRDKEHSGTLDGTERWLGGGDRIGFTTAESGELLAIAGEETFPILAPLPKRARRVVWYSRREEPSELTKATGGFLRDAATVAVVGGLSAVVIVSALEHQHHHHDNVDCCKRRRQ